MNAVKIFYMSLVKENIPIFGVVSYHHQLVSVEVVYTGRVYNKGEGSIKRNI